MDKTLLGFIFATILLLALVCVSAVTAYLLIQTDQSNKFIIESNQTHEGEISGSMDVEIKNSAQQNGDINIEEGNVALSGNVVINGSITIQDGNLTFGDSVNITGEVIVKDGNVTVGGNNQLQRVSVDDGNVTGGNSNNFQSIKVASGNVTLGSNNSIFGNLTCKDGNVVIMNSNSIDGDISAQTLVMGSNNTIQGEYPK